jgi:nucleotide-binding universal stress UspA family protein
MATTLATPAAGTQLIENDLHLLGPIVVATDGTASADAAMRAAAQMSTHGAVDVHAIAVLEPLPLVAADYGLLLPPADAEEARRDALRQRVHDQVREVAGDSALWHVTILDGDPASVIARTARELKARVIIVGIGHHDLIDRLFGGETALHVLRLSRVPVWAVATPFTALPTRAIVAIDFSMASVRSARAALGVFDTLTMVYLAHVAPRLELQPEAFAAWMTAYGEGVEPAFARVQAELQLPDTVTVETLTLQGKPSRELLDFARSAHADLVVTGSRGAGLMDRLLVGSTATGLIRGSACSVFGVPAPVGGERLVTVPPQQRVSLAEAEWAKALDAFTKRNAGRRATLEVDDPEFGAQTQEHDYPFLGAAYDHHDRRVELMLGDQEGVRRHLTRGIANVRAIDELRDEHGRDWILRIRHGSGQTLLMLAR